MPGPALEISYPHVFAVVDTRSGKAACGCCGRDLTAPRGVVTRALAGEDGTDRLGPELVPYMGVATEVWRERRLLPTEDIAGHVPLDTGQDYGYCGNCEAPLVIPVAEHGRPLHQGGPHGTL